MALTDEYMPEEESPRAAIDAILAAENLADGMPAGKSDEIAEAALRDYRLDKDSMSDWFDRMDRGIKLAQLVKDEKDYPFSGAANIKYPLITSAALQFNARAYPAIVPPDRPVKARVWGKDPGGQKAARGDRLSEHMSFQLLSTITEWEESTDKLLVQLPIVGEMFRKWWFDPVDGRPKCRLLEAGKFIVNDKVTCLEQAPRGTEEMSLFPHEVDERVRSGRFIEFEREDDDEAPHEFIEQQCRWDLDEDGYAEPYIVTVHCETQKLVRMVADFEQADVIYKTEERQVPVVQMMQNPQTGAVMPITSMTTEAVETGIIAIRRNVYIVAFNFWPALDGGFHGTGLGLLLGDISDSINTIINMSLDAGHYASLGGGFLGKELRMKGGANRFKPGEWKQALASGNDIRSAIVPLTFPGPDATLFQMLGLLIEAGREIASIKDVVTGEQPRQQQTATTTLALIEQGMMVFTAAYKRIFRSCKQEYKLLAGMNARTLQPEEYQQFHDEQVDPRQDYNLSDMDIQPVADPRSVTKMQQAAKAQIVMQMAEMGLVDRGEATRRITEAMDIEDSEELQPQPDPMQEQIGMLQLQSAQADLADKAAKTRLTLAQIDKTMMETEETRAQIAESITSAQNDTARVALEAKQQRMDGFLKVLEEDRARLEAVLRGSGRMGNASDDQAGQGGGGQGVAGPERAAIGGLLGGSGVPGGGSQGPGIV